MVDSLGQGLSRRMLTTSMGRTPDNIHFEIEDLESPWTYTEDSFDYIHARVLIGAVSDWDSIDRRA